jgi:glucose dehydrogenase
MKRVGFLAASIICSMVVLGSGTENGEWRHYSGDLRATKYSPLDQIDRDNVARLKIAWRRPHIDQDIAIHDRRRSDQCANACRRRRR